MKFKDIVDYIKLEHTVFDLPFILSGYVIAAGTSIFPYKIILILIAAVTARSSAMSINRIEGLRYDLTNPRKKEWALVSGRMTVREAIALTILFIAVFEISAFLLNRLVFILSPIVIFLFVSDPILKRYTEWRHFYMGSAIGIGTLAGYLAVIPEFPSNLAIYFLFIASSLWIAGFDMIYVIPDIEYDQKNKLKTVMTKYGIKLGLLISDITHLAALIFFWLMLYYFRTIWYLAGLIIITILVIYQHIIVDPADPLSIRKSFFNANSFIGFIFLITVILSVASPLWV
ncbi:UbiA-like polyprenyltransferase [Thermoplasma volcanium]|nr:UbiA-like polyprenyltransferase [Thermoplasma volcanium]